MKKDAYYFSHDANSQDDPKCMVLIDQLGMEGYGIFWALIEKLRNEKDYKLPLLVVNSLSRRWGTSKEKVESVIKNYSLFVVENDLFFSIRLQRSMEEKSEKARISANYRWKDADALQSHTNRIANDIQNDAIKEKESKEKKVKESKEKKTDFLAPDLSKSNLFREPVIPTKKEVLEVFVQNGGTKEMAKSFWESNETTGWFYKGSPITNFRNRVGSFVENWIRNESSRPNKVNNDNTAIVRDIETKRNNEILGIKN